MGLEELYQMFPQMDQEVIQTVFISHDSNTEAALNALLEMSDPSQKTVVL